MMTAALEPVRVLIVEDEALVALNAEAVLEGGGFVVTGVAMTFAQAQALAAAAVPPDVALVDVNLADGRTGPDVAVLLVAQGCAVVVATGNPEGMPADAAVHSVLRKPYSDASLLAAVREAAAARAAQAFPAPGCKRTGKIGA
jgi:two-component system, response regulator PdtaR